jgi:hypothetical protein
MMIHAFISHLACLSVIPIDDVGSGTQVEVIPELRNVGPLGEFYLSRAVAKLSVTSAALIYPSLFWHKVWTHLPKM